jgi:hypothetical protein
MTGRSTANQVKSMVHHAWCARVRLATYFAPVSGYSRCPGVDRVVLMLEFRARLQLGYRYIAIESSTVLKYHEMAMTL